MADNKDFDLALYLLVALAAVLAAFAFKNTVDIKWSLKNEAVRCVVVSQ